MNESNEGHKSHLVKQGKKRKKQDGKTDVCFFPAHSIGVQVANLSY